MRFFNSLSANLRVQPSTAQPSGPRPKRFNIRSAVRYILSGVELDTPDTPALAMAITVCKCCNAVYYSDTISQNNSLWAVSSTKLEMYYYHSTILARAPIW